MDWEKHTEDYSYIVSGKSREKIFKELKSPMTPSQLATATQLHLSDVSRVLRGLSDRKLVVCMTPKKKVGRIYRRTEKGEEIAEQMLKALE